MKGHLKGHLNAVIVRSILAHGPVTKAAVAVALTMDLTTVERAIGQLLSAGIIGGKGHEPDGDPLYTALTS